MKVLHLISSIGFFGAERVVCELCRTQEVTELAMQICVLTGDSGLLDSFRKAVCRSDVPVVGIPCKGKLDFNLIKNLQKLIDEDGIDVVHCHGYKSNFYAAILKSYLKRPVLLFSTNHNWIGLTLNEKLYQAIDCLMLRRFERVIAVSDQVKRDMIRRWIPADKVKVIHNGIDVDDPDFRFDRTAARRELGLDENDIVLGNVARFTAEKAHAELIEAVSILLRDFSKIRLVIIGDGPERHNLEKIVENKELNGHVSLPGNTDHARRLYSAFDIFILPSLNEGLPMVLLEAMAAGVPVVASAVGAIPQVLENNKSGLLIRAGDTMQLTDSLRQAITDSQLLEKLSLSGMRAVHRHYSNRKMARQYYDLYTSTMRREAV